MARARVGVAGHGRMGVLARTPPRVRLVAAPPRSTLPLLGAEQGLRPRVGARHQPTAAGCRMPERGIVARHLAQKRRRLITVDCAGQRTAAVVIGCHPLLAVSLPVTDSFY